MASLHPAPALAAAANRNIKTAHHGSPDNLLLVLGFAAFRLHAAATMRAALRQWHGDTFIHPPRSGAAGLPAVAPAWFAPRALRVGFGCTARMRRGLTFAGAQRGFQFPAQTLGLLLQALVFLL